VAKATEFQVAIVRGEAFMASPTLGLGAIRGNHFLASGTLSKMIDVFLAILL
jgi:hypothetical protein